MNNLTKLDDEFFTDENSVTWVIQTWIDNEGVVRIVDTFRKE